MAKITDDQLAGAARRAGVLFSCGRDLAGCCHLETILESLNYEPSAWEEHEKDELRIRIIRLGKEGKVNTGGRSHRWTKCCPLREDRILQHAKAIMREMNLAGDALVCSTPAIRMIFERSGYVGDPPSDRQIDDTRRILLTMRKNGLLKMPKSTPLFGGD